MSENIQYIIAEDGYYYVAYKEKAKVPEIVVSSKGIANGLSEEYNDGWDFGPDSYNPNSTASIPYTQTAGIQEAINYVFNNGGVVELTEGIYDITNAPFQSDPNNSGAEGQLVIPLNTTDSTINISIIGKGFTRGGAEEGTSAGDFTGGVTIRSLATSSATYPSILYSSRAPSGKGAGGTTLNNVNLWLDGLHIQGNPSGSVSGMDMTWIVSCNIGKLYIDTYYTGTSYPYAPPAINSGKAIAWAINPDVSIMQYAAVIYTAGFSEGIVTNLTHAYIGELVSQWNKIGIQNPTSTSYSGAIGLYSVQMTAIHIYCSTSANMSILSYDWGDDTTSSTAVQGPFTYNVQTTTSNVVIDILNFSNSSGIAPAFSNSSGSIIRVDHFMSSDGAPYIPVPTTPAVPASGTAQQNTNPYAVDVYVYGGDVTEIQITKGGTAYTVFSNSTGLSLSGQAYRLNPGDSITITYSTAPSWEWLSD